jgi:hypothetical protein
MARKLFLTRLSEFGTNDLVVTTGKGHVIDVLQHGCKGIDFPLALDHILYEGKVYDLSTPAKKRRLSTQIRGDREVRLVPVQQVNLEDIAGCVNDRSIAGVRTLEFIKQHFDLRWELT